MFYAIKVVEIIALFLYNEAHWLFCAQYLVVQEVLAETLTKKIKSKKICSRRCIIFLNVLYPLLIISGQVWTQIYPQFYDVPRIWLMLIPLGVLVFSLIRIRSMISNPQTGASLNITYMTLHVLILVLLVINNALYVIVDFVKYLNHNLYAKFWMVTILRLTALTSMTLLLIILYKVSSGLEKVRKRRYTGKLNFTLISETSRSISRLSEISSAPSLHRISQEERGTATVESVSEEAFL